MKILVTGSAGRIGRAIYIRLMHEHRVVGIDRTPCSTTNFVGDINDNSLLESALDKVDAVVHVAALHAPHVGIVSDNSFIETNVHATERLARLAVKHGVRQFIFTSTTALYGAASTPVGRAGWIDESVEPQPKTVYHRSKIEAESALFNICKNYELPVTVLQISRCFPERADLMALYRLTRGIDYRDVADAHACAIDKNLPGFNRFIVSGKTPFDQTDCQNIFDDAPSLLERKAPELVQAFSGRGWALPRSLDRIYSSEAAQRKLEWKPKFGWESVLELLDDGHAEVLPI